MHKIQKALKSLIILSIFSCSSLQANLLFVNDAGQTIRQGDVFSLTISGSGFNTPLDAGGINIAFDSNIIRVALLDELPEGITEQVELNALWDVEPLINPVISSNSIDDIFFFSSGFDAIGDFDIATLWFKAMTSGNSQIKFTDSQFIPFQGGSGVLAVAVLDGEVKIQAVPIPAAFWFMITGVFGMIIRR